MTCGLDGSIMVAWGTPGPQAGGGQHLSPRLNQLLQELLRPHELQPTRLAMVTTTPVSMSSFFVLSFFSRGAQECRCFRSNSRRAGVRCKRNGCLLASGGQESSRRVAFVRLLQEFGVVALPRGRVMHLPARVEKMLH